MLPRGTCNLYNDSLDFCEGAPLRTIPVLTGDAAMPGDVVMVVTYTDTDIDFDNEITIERGLRSDWATKRDSLMACFNFDDAIEKCSSNDRYLTDDQGLTATDTCCACGVVIVEGGVIDAPSTSSDVPDWHNSDGANSDCMFYDDYFNCKSYGLTRFESFG
jgi:hypothetical protein